MQAVLFLKKHLFEEAADCWDEVKTVTDQGEETSFRLAFWEGEINQAWMAGGIAGTDHYMMMAIEYAENSDAGRSRLYRFFETDEDMQILNSFYVDCLDRVNLELPDQIMVEASGNIHMITSNFSDGTSHYYVVSPDGTFLAEGSSAGGDYKDSRLVPLYDGRVGLLSGKKLMYLDAGTGEISVLADISFSYRYCTLSDENTLLYADGEGLHRSDLSGENPEILYTWSNHGIAAASIEGIQVSEDQCISLIYQDSMGANYLKLKPTTEEVEIQEITFAVSSNWGDKYRSAVTEFNKRYPACHIKVEMYGYGDSSLLTEMTAGKGPVLIDTGLLGFESNAKWWEPLDDFFKAAGLEEELIPKVMEFGKIDGTLYGVVTDFSLNTVVTLAEEPEGWDYDTFLSCFDEDDPSMKSVVTALEGSGGSSFVKTFFVQSLADSYLFDAESCTTFFDSDEFRKILKLGAGFMKRDRRGNSEDLRQDTSPCGIAYIQKPESLACLRIWGGERLRYIGYPSKTGSGHYINGGNPVTIRANATAAEKRIARTFLQILLSYDLQLEASSDTLNTNFSMSVRKDVLEEQIDRMNEDTYTLVPGFPQIHLEDQVNKELDRATLYELLEKAEPQRNLPSELSKILLEELEEYFGGNLTEDMLIDHLANRVELYLLEQK